MNTPGNQPEATRAAQERILPSNVTPASTGEESDGGQPGVSASRVILVLLVVLALAAVLVPVPLHRPAWVEAEAVVGVWWVVWAVALAWMLYAGVGLRNDLTIRAHMRNEDARPWWGHITDLRFGDLDLGGLDESGCVALLVGVVLVGLLILGGWILLEVIFPLVIPLGYGLMLLLLTRVVHRHSNCRGQPLKAMVFGVSWASVYTVPLVLAVALVHLMLT